MKITKIILSLTCVAVFLVLAVGSTGNDDEPKALEDTSPAEVIEMPEPEEELPYEEIEESITEEAEEFLIESALNIMKSSFENYAKAEVNKADKMFILTPTDATVIGAFAFVAAGNTEVLPAYEEYVQSQIEMSKAIADLLPEYSVATANPNNTDLLLLVIWNGIVIYNFADEL
jgi:hypothetical protein